MSKCSRLSLKCDFIKLKFLKQLFHNYVHDGYKVR